MKILFDINHPANVHFFKNVIKILEKNNHNIIITAREKEMTTHLLKKYGLEFKVVSSMGKGLIGLTKELFTHEKKIYNILRDNKIDISLSVGGTFNVHACRLLDIPSIVFYDTEHAKLQNSITYPFADVVCTPACYRDDLGKKQIRYNGYQELAYLHPNYFKPDPSILNLLGVEKDEKYVVMRFVAWGASHDVGQTGLSLDMKRKAVKEFSRYAKVFITSEGKMPEDLDKYRIRIPPERIHDALYYASLYVGEGATMASECAVLGTPAIYVNTLSAGTLEEQEQKYGLIFQIIDGKEVIMKGVELLKNWDLKKDWRKKRKKLIEDKIDGTAFMVWLIENYPESTDIIKENPNFLERFK